MMSTDGPFCSKDLEPSTAIYRIHPHKRLDTLLSGKLILRSTTTWLEPYENLLSRCGYGYISDGKIKQASTFVSQKGEAADIRKQNYKESVDWYAGIVADVFGS